MRILNKGQAHFLLDQQTPGSADAGLARCGRKQADHSMAWLMGQALISSCHPLRYNYLDIETFNKRTGVDLRWEKDASLALLIMIILSLAVSARSVRACTIQPAEAKELPVEAAYRAHSAGVPCPQRRRSGFRQV